eukprot:CAMPEP_0114544148 /NCGR_PEP_ID=MMETSP0114-20121206/2723_1 /TAXON_ID=31324 /ORGANISM="Goniomonas sp, Strain m" /LENGTH=329 /DNA_ID=CAMNT_0001728511 /DNA_START=17 /DNA_END=1003 /DNA_ORIENTATION=+
MSTCADFDLDEALREEGLALSPKTPATPRPDDRVIMLSVGGMHFTAARSTLTKHDSYFSRMFSGRFDETVCKDPTGRCFIDRDGTHFRHILNFLRDGSIPAMLDSQAADELAREANFYGLTKMVEVLDKSDTTLGMFNEITGDSLRVEYDIWVREKNLRERAMLGESFNECVRLMFQGIRSEVLKGHKSGSLALLTSNKLPTAMSFSHRGKVVALIPPDNKQRELPLMYHDWAGSRRKMDFNSIQQEVWNEMLETALVSPDFEIIWDEERRPAAVDQIKREFDSRKLKQSISKEVWLNITTPVYNGCTSGSSDECPVVADFCSGWFLKW